MTIILSDWPDAKPGAPHLDSTRRARTRCLDALVPYSASKFKKPEVVSTEPVRHGPAAVDNGRVPSAREAQKSTALQKSSIHFTSLAITTGKVVAAPTSSWRAAPTQILSRGRSEHCTDLDDFHRLLGC